MCKQKGKQNNHNVKESVQAVAEEERNKATSEVHI